MYLRWHQCNKIRCSLSFYLLGRTHIPADVHNFLEDTQTLPVSRNAVTTWFIVVLFGSFLSGHALLNASQTAANDFDAKRTNTYCAREHTVFAPAHILRNWREQRSCKKGDLDLSDTGRLGKSYTGVNILWQCVIDLGLCLCGAYCRVKL
jgi:hypothetical protein